MMTYWMIIKLAVYKQLLFCMYYFLLAVYWEESNFVQLNGLSLWSQLFSWSIFLISLPLAAKILKNENIDGNIFFALYLVYFIPALVFWEFNPEPWDYIFAQILYFTAMGLAILNIPEIKLRTRPAHGCEKFYLLTLLAVATTIIFYFIATGSSLLFSLKNVYDVRALRVMNQQPLLLNYIFSNCRIMLPLLFGIAVYRKAYLHAVIVLFLVLMAFSVDGLKSIAFITILTGAGVGFTWRNRHILDGVLGISACGLIEFGVFGSYQIVDYLRRILAVPAQLNRFFYDFFSQPDHPYDLFRQSIAGKLGFESPYDMNIYQIIGGEYYGKWEMYANNGLVGDAFYNLGWPGIIIMPIFVVLLVKIIGACSVGLPKQILLGVTVATTYWLITSSFFTLFLTHGVAMMIMFLYFLPSLKKDEMAVPYE